MPETPSEPPSISADVTVPVFIGEFRGATTLTGSPSAAYDELGAGARTSGKRPAGIEGIRTAAEGEGDLEAPGVGSKLVRDASRIRSL